MKTTEDNKRNISANRALTNLCLASCRKLITQIRRTKDVILAEFRETRLAHEHLLQLALNEAEALAWQTDYPHLVFPTLAREKAQAVVAWATHQHSIWRPASRISVTG